MMHFAREAPPEPVSVNIVNRDGAHDQFAEEKDEE
jgi:hypothetical protein